jgi:hypothetical protein
MDRVYLAMIRIHAGGSWGQADTPQKAAELAGKALVRDWFTYRKRAQSGHAKAAIYDITDHNSWVDTLDEGMLDGETGEPIKRHSFEWVFYIAA